VLIDGTDIARLSEDELAALRNRVVGFVFQFHYLLDELTCLENVLTPITIGAIIRAGEPAEDCSCRRADREPREPVGR
jgi:ABC-type lipoprotein export system ATPase subunit